MKLRTLSLSFAACAVLVLAVRGYYRESLANERKAEALAKCRTPEKYRRDAQYTYLTIPEWYLVWSPQEYAEFVVDQSPSEFPYLGHLKQFWRGYRDVAERARDYPRSADYHIMIVVIGASTTVEYGLKGLYEIPWEGSPMPLGEADRPTKRS